MFNNNASFSREGIFLKKNLPLEGAPGIRNPELVSLGLGLVGTLPAAGGPMEAGCLVARAVFHVGWSVDVGMKVMRRGTGGLLV